MHGFMRLRYLTVSHYTVAQAIMNTKPLNKTQSQVILTFAIKDIYYTYTEHQGTQQKKGSCYLNASNLHCPLINKFVFINTGSFYINRFMKTVRARRLKKNLILKSFSAVMRGHDKEILFKPQLSLEIVLFSLYQNISFQSNVNVGNNQEMVYKTRSNKMSSLNGDKVKIVY